MSATLVMTGDRELERKLDKLEPKLAKKAITTSLRAGGATVRRATKAEASVDRGTMKRAIITRAAKRSRNRPGTYALLQFFNTRKYPELVKVSRGGKRAFYPAAIEYGRAGPGKAGGVKAVPAKSFVREGFYQSWRTAASVIIHKLKTAIEAAWRGR